MGSAEDSALSWSPSRYDPAVSAAGGLSARHYDKSHPLDSEDGDQDQCSTFRSKTWLRCSNCFDKELECSSNSIFTLVSVADTSRRLDLTRMVFRLPVQELVLMLSCL